MLRIFTFHKSFGMLLVDFIMKNIQERYKKAKESKVGDECICAGCGTKFTKSSYQQAFCKTRKGTKCKDAYWNRVTPEKRSNTTRISPASAAWMARQDSSMYSTVH